MRKQIKELEAYRKDSFLFGSGFLNKCKLPTSTTNEAVCFGLFLGQMESTTYLITTSNTKCNVAKLSLKPNCVNLTGEGQIYDNFIKYLENNPKELYSSSASLINKFCFK